MTVAVKSFQSSMLDTEQLLSSICVYIHWVIDHLAQTYEKPIVHFLAEPCQKDPQSYYLVVQCKWIKIHSQSFLKFLCLLIICFFSMFPWPSNVFYWVQETWLGNILALFFFCFLYIYIWLLCYLPSISSVTWNSYLIITQRIHEAYFVFWQKPT